MSTFSRRALGILFIFSVAFKGVLANELPSIDYGVQWGERVETQLLQDPSDLDEPVRFRFHSFDAYFYLLKDLHELNGVDLNSATTLEEAGVGIDTLTEEQFLKLIEVVRWSWGQAPVSPYTEAYARSVWHPERRVLIEFSCKPRLPVSNSIRSHQTAIDIFSAMENNFGCLEALRQRNPGYLMDSEINIPQSTELGINSLIGEDIDRISQLLGPDSSYKALHLILPYGSFDEHNTIVESSLVFTDPVVAEALELQMYHGRYQAVPGVIETWDNLYRNFLYNPEYVQKFPFGAYSISAIVFPPEQLRTYCPVSRPCEVSVRVRFSDNSSKEGQVGTGINDVIYLTALGGVVGSDMGGVVGSDIDRDSHESPEIQSGSSLGKVSQEASFSSGGDYGCSLTSPMKTPFFNLISLICLFIVLLLSYRRLLNSQALKR